MNERRRRSIRRCGVWVVALTGHALLYLLLVRNAGPPVRQGAFMPEQPILLMLDLSRPAEEELPAPPEPTRTARLSIPRPADHTDESPAPNTAITAPAPMPDPAAPVDWANEARIAARAATDGSGKPTSREFGEPLKPARGKCEKRASSFEWNPEPKRAGFIGILPYVRLGNCIVGLGFFGCTLGASEPNSHLFDDMSDPDHITTSVPDVDRCD